MPGGIQLTGQQFIQPYTDQADATPEHILLWQHLERRSEASQRLEPTVMPNYLLSMSDHKVILRNYEGYITTYEEPVEYKPHDPKTCKYCQNKRMEPGQTGITGLLDGDEMFIKPEGFDQMHDRHGIQHRLKDESKWKPLGIGAGEEKS